MKRFQTFWAVLFSITAFAIAAWADWPNNAAENLVICNRNGEQTIPKVAATSDGGCYVAWYDHGSGNYDVYLQKLDGSGVPQWTENGILISNHPQDTWLTDWEITVDDQDYCILAINDIRAGGDWDIYGYRISPRGDFAWGPNGVTLSNNTTFEATPRVIATSGGNAVFAWQEEADQGYLLHMRKISPTGQDVWNPATITLTSTLPYGLSIPRIAPCENDGVIIQYLVHQGSGMYAQRHIYAQKFDSLGSPQWTAGGVLISNAGGISLFMFPDLISDGAGGAISFWYDTRDANRHHVWVQHVSSAGNMLWTANGVRTSMSATELQMSPAISYNPDNGDVFAFYQITNSGQTQDGLGGQLINAAGQVQWGADGIAFRPLGSPQTSYIDVITSGNDAIVVYEEGASISDPNSYVWGFRVDREGNLVWGDRRVLSSVSSAKTYLNADANPAGQVLAVWRDGRSTSDDIYLQNINPDGTLGNFTSNPSIEITAPADSSEFFATPSHLYLCYSIDNFEVATQGGDGLIRLYIRASSGQAAEFFISDPDSIDLIPLDPWPAMLWFSITTELVDYAHQPLSPQAMDSIHIRIVPAPNIEITAPEDSSEFVALPSEEIVLRYTVDNFTVAPQNGDGEIRLNIRTNWNDVDYYINDPDSVDLTSYVNLFWHTITVELVDYQHQALDPPALDSVHIFIFEVSADEQLDLLPKRITLFPAYPNPFNPGTTIRFALPQAQLIKLRVYDVLGREVAQVADGLFPVGNHELYFDGSGLASGTYIYRLETPTTSLQRTMLLVK